MIITKGMKESIRRPLVDNWGFEGAIQIAPFWTVIYEGQKLVLRRFLEENKGNFQLDL